MNLAGLSCELYNSRFRHVRYSAADGLSPADVVVWSPAASIQEYRLRFEAQGGPDDAPLLDLAGTEAFLHDERRRRDELAALLDRGGLAIVDLSGDARIRIHTVETIFELDLATALPHPGAGRAEPAPAGCTVAACTSGEPFRSFALAASAGRAAAWRLSRHPGTVLARGGDGAVLGFHAGIGTGHLLGLPLDLAGAGPERMAALLDPVAELAASLGAVRHGALPPWVDCYLTDAEQALRDAAEQAAAEIAHLQRRQAALARERERLRSRRALVFTGGRLLAEAAADALRCSGGAVLQAQEGEGDLVVERNGRISVVAIAARPIADPAAATAALAAAAGREAARAGCPAGAVLLLAGEQDLPPDRRAVPQDDPALLRRAADQGITMLTTLELYAMARAAGETPGAADWDAWLDRPPRPAALPDWRHYLAAANQSG